MERKDTWSSLPSYYTPPVFPSQRLIFTAAAVLNNELLLLTSHLGLGHGGPTFATTA